MIELCQQSLGWGDVNYDRDNQGRRLIRSLRLRTDEDTVLTLDDALSSDNLTDNLSDNLKLSDEKGSDNPDNNLNLKTLKTEDQLSSPMIKVDEPAESFENPTINEPESFEELASQVVSQGCQLVVSEVISQPSQPKTPRLEEGLSDIDKLSRLTKNRRHYPTLWYTGIEDIPRRLRFRSVELWFDEQTVIAFPDGWQSPRRFVLNEIEFVYGTANHQGL